MILCLHPFVFTHVCRSNTLTSTYWALVFIQRGSAIGKSHAVEWAYCGCWMMTQFTQYIELSVLFPSNLLFSPHFTGSQIEPHFSKTFIEVIWNIKLQWNMMRHDKQSYLVWPKKGTLVWSGVSCWSYFFLVRYIYYHTVTVCVTYTPISIY